MVDRSPPGGVTSRAEHGKHKTGDTHSDNTGAPNSHNRQSTVNVHVHVMLLCIVYIQFDQFEKLLDGDRQSVSTVQVFSDAMI